MSALLADVERRIGSVHQLDAVVNAMRGIAGARAQQSRQILPAIRTYAETAGRAIAQARRIHSAGPAMEDHRGAPGQPALVLFGAEQGFAGAYPERVLDAAAADFPDAHVFLIGARSAALAGERGLATAWQASLPGRVAALPDVATLTLDALYDYLAAAGAVPVTMIYPFWKAGEGLKIIRRPLLPLDSEAFPASGSGPVPLANMPPADLLAKLVQEYVFAQLCEAAAEAFAAENEARMATMAAAKTHIDGKLAALQLEERLTRQSEITAEVVELAAGARFRAKQR
ncbi:H(+)-transporting ATPase (plasmid) [Sphingomonas panacis]|uniref:H(+)-transporting ATPase n=1 Tax=Sphingomonas panacis TaxID=1560345 RepID=A0A1B3ZHX7_9SPHN|nr:F0F1 ATP synthase subunit gamma [Sphingomonas panacis]AOH87038.1 H(+)-transporting ATPase [Sphingomonas panacis]